MPADATYYDFTDTLPRPGGGDWNLSDLSSLQIGVQSTNAVAKRLTSLWTIVNFTPPGLMFLLFR